MSDWAGRVQRLEAEVSGLRRAMRNRGLIEQAKGRLAERWGVDAEQAFDMLSKLSQESNVRVVEMAAELMGSPVPTEADAAGVVVSPDGTDEDGWIEPLVDVVDEPLFVLSPLWTNETLADFRIDHANSAGVRRWGLSGGSPRGRRLVDTAPELAVDGTVELLVRAYHGEPTDPASAVRAARIGDRLIVSWPTPQRPDASWIEELGGLGWGRWSRTSVPLEFSVGLYRVLGRDPADGPLSLDHVIAQFAPADRHRARGLVAGVADPPIEGEGESYAASTVEVTLARSGRRLRVYVLPRQDVAVGRDRDVLALFQDVSES